MIDMTNMDKIMLMKNEKKIGEVANEDMPSRFSLIEMVTLKVVRTGTDDINFKILKILPSNINTVMKELNMTKVPVNVRVNGLEKLGLVGRFKGTGNVILTDFGKFFIDTIESYGKLVRRHTFHILDKHMDKHNG